MAFAQSRNFLASIFYQEHERLALWIPVLFGVGVGIYFYLPFEPDIRELAGLLIASIVGLRFSWRRSFLLRVLFLALLLVAAGAFCAGMRTREVAAPVLHKPSYFKEVTGKVSDIQIREKGEKLFLSKFNIEGLTPEETPLQITVSLKEVAEGLRVGDEVRLKPMLFPPPTPAMPGSYDFARMFYYQQIGAVGFSPKPPEIIQKAEADSFSQWLNGLRLAITDRILAPMDKENGWIAAAMMVGEQSGVSKEAADAMREAGIYHVLSISGLHMSLAVMIMYISTRFLLSLYPPFALRFNIKKIAAAIGLLSSFSYLLLAGYPVPAVRSFIMVACVMLAILVDREGISIFSLAWAALLTLLWQPESLLGASFQLSFAATVGIVAFYERYSYMLHKPNSGIIHKIWLYFLGIILTSLIASLATTPLVIYHFNRFTLWGIAANMLMLPLASAWIMPCAVLALLLMPLGLEHYPLVALNSGISLMMRGARLFADLPYAAISLPSPSFFGIVIAVIGGLWLVIWQGRSRLFAIPFIILGVATSALYKPYDLLISDDAGKVALRLENGEFLFLRGKPDSFDGQMWLRIHGQEEGLTSKEIPEKTGYCDKDKCEISAYGKRIIVVKTKDREGGAEICAAKPDIVIAGIYLDRNPACANVPFLLDKAFLQENGATALRFINKNALIETAAQFRGLRPWVTGWKKE